MTSAKGQAEEITILAKAEKEKNRAAQVAITPLTVMMHAYDALGKLGGSGTSIMLGDWSRTPSFLFPGFGGLGGGLGMPAPMNRHSMFTLPRLTPPALARPSVTPPVQYD